MQITKCSIGPGVIAVDDLQSYAFSMTLKMGSSERISNQPIDINLILNNGDHEEGLSEYSWGLLSEAESSKLLGFEGVTIGKGASKALTTECYAPWSEGPGYKYENVLDMLKQLSGDNGAARAYPCGLRVWAWASETSGYEAYFNNAVTLLLEREVPTIGTPVITDDRLGLNGEMALNHFGAFVQNESIPRMVFPYTLDALDPSLTPEFTLCIYPPGYTVGGDVDAIIYESTNGIFVVDPLTVPGSYSWTCYIIDSAGQSNEISGEFDVLAYARPAVTLAAQRYTMGVDDEGNPIYTESEDGTHVRFDLTASVHAVEGKNTWTLIMTYGPDDVQDLAKTLRSGTGGLELALVEDRSLITDEISPVYPWTFTVTIMDFFDVEYATDDVGRAGGDLSVESYGVGVGMRSTAAAGNKKFEVAPGYRAFLYGGIGQIGDGWTYLAPLTGTTPGEYGGGALRCRMIENKCIVAGSLLVKAGSSTIALAQLPDGYTPEKSVFSLNACSGGRVARIAVHGAEDEYPGHLCLSWIKNLTNGTDYTTAAIWVQCSIEYWAENTQDAAAGASLLDADGNAVVDADGNNVVVYSADEAVYQSRYTGLQLDAGIAAANNALPRSGGSMSGSLFLNTDPASDDEAVNKSYLEKRIGEVELTPGDSAYEIAVKEGYEGTQEEWLASLQGVNGKSAYEYAQTGGFTGTEEEFMALLGKMGNGSELDSVSWKKVTGKPYGNPITGSVEVDGENIIWDGNEDGMYAVNDFIFVSDNLPTKEEICAGGSMAYVDSSGVEHEYNKLGAMTETAEGENLLVYYDDGDMMHVYIYVCKNVADASSYSETFERPGIYFRALYGGAYISRFTIAGFAWTETEELAKIPEEHIDERIARQEDLDTVKAKVDAMLYTASGIKWDGVVADRSVATNISTTGQYVCAYRGKITVDQLCVGGFTVYAHNGTPYSYTEEEAYALINELTASGSVYALQTGAGWIYVCNTAGGATINGLITLPETGVYFCLNEDGSYISSLVSDGVNEATEQTLIRAEMLPIIDGFVMQTPGGKQYKITMGADGEFIKTLLE